MKMILAAIALTIASPAVAQTSAPAGPHANHAPAQQQGQAGQSGSSSTDHAGHDMHGEGCCAKMKAEGKKMECCDKPAGAAAEADPHAGHNMSGQ